MTASSIDPTDFVASVKPLLASRNARKLSAHLRERWSPQQITELLHSDDADARNVAILALAMVGEKCCVPLLADLLRSADPSVNELAEHALWSIWFRSGSPEANHELNRGAVAINCKQLLHAVEHFDRAVGLCPDFAEAFNQRAIAYYLLEEYEESLRDCQRAAELMPCHFGAWAGAGHCQAHIGDTDGAIASYERAVEINPNLPCIKQAILELRARL